MDAASGSFKMESEPIQKKIALDLPDPVWAR
jgi:hypothetical protein